MENQSYGKYSQIFIFILSSDYHLLDKIFAMLGLISTLLKQQSHQDLSVLWSDVTSESYHLISMAIFVFKDIRLYFMLDIIKLFFRVPIGYYF